MQEMPAEKYVVETAAAMYSFLYLEFDQHANYAIS